MKNLLSSLVILAFIMGGCAFDESSTGPEPISTQQQILELPESDVVLEKSRVFSNEIDGTVGGSIDFYMKYNSRGKKITISGTLEIPAGAFGTKTKIFLHLDSKRASVDLYPSPMSFDIPLKLSITYEGLNLANLNINQVDFFYVNQFTNAYELLNSSGKVFDASNGILGIRNAELPHFSRFAWVK